MQSIFRMPWSADPTSRPPVLDKSALWTKPLATPTVVELPRPKTLKRKRVASVDGSPHAAQTKKVKGVWGGGESRGAVKMAPTPSKAADSSLTAGAGAERGSRVEDGGVGGGGKEKVAESFGMNSIGCSGVEVKESKGDRGHLMSNLGSGTITAQQDHRIHQTIDQNRKISIDSTLHSTLDTPALSSFNPTQNISITTLPPSSQPISDSSIHTHSSRAARRTTTVSMSNDTLDRARAIVNDIITDKILAKHNELRLIDQEMAKCQVALEQIRRCSLIPYPGHVVPSLSLSQGVGPALVAPQGTVPPTHPAPWGVTDNPYTRHYARWLISTPSNAIVSFDPSTPNLGQPMYGSGAGLPIPGRDAGRVTRASGGDLTPASLHQPRSFQSEPGRTRSSLTGAPNSPTIKEDRTIIKRAEDGQWVKLWCTMCNPERGNFANVQGFLNHCRISHKKDFKSHEAAAIACGRIVPPDQLPSHLRQGTGKTTGANKTAAPRPQPAPKESNVAVVVNSTPRSAVPKIVVPTSSVEKPFVHEYVHNPPAAKEKVPWRHPTERLALADVSRKQARFPVLNNSGSKLHQTEAPYLQAAAGEFGVENITERVKAAKEKVDTSEYDYVSDSEVPAKRPKLPQGSKHAALGGTRPVSSICGNPDHVSKAKASMNSSPESKSQPRTSQPRRSCIRAADTIQDPFTNGYVSALPHYISGTGVNAFSLPPPGQQQRSASLRTHGLPSHAAPASAPYDHPQSEESGISPLGDITPHTPADSNPGLVSDSSDREEDEDELIERVQPAPGHDAHADALLVRIEDADADVGSGAPDLGRGDAICANAAGSARRGRGKN